MFDAVRATTDEDDVIGFFRARAMNLYSDRRSLQVTSLAHVLERTDYYVMATNSTYSQVLISDEEADAAGLEGVGEPVLHHLGHARRGDAMTRWSG